MGRWRGSKMLTGDVYPTCPQVLREKRSRGPALGQPLSQPPLPGLSPARTSRAPLRAVIILSSVGRSSGDERDAGRVVHRLVTLRVRRRLQPVIGVSNPVDDTPDLVERYTAIMTSPAPVRLPIPGAAQATLKFTQGGQEGAIVLGFVTTNALNEAKAVAARDAAWTAFRPLMTTSVTCTGLVLRDTSGPDIAPVEVGPPATNASGLANGNALAAGCTLIRWQTAVGGRTGRGRTYLPGLPAGAVDPANGRLYEAATKTATATAITNYLSAAGLSSNALVPAVLSFSRGLARPITSGSIAQVVGIQRRRMR